MRNLELLAGFALLLWSAVCNGNDRVFMQPLELPLGSACTELKNKYATELVAEKNKVQTLNILEPKLLFPRASKMVASCDNGVFDALVISAEPLDSQASNVVSVFSQLEREADKKYGCPELEDKAFRCAIFQKTKVFVVYTGEYKDSAEFALVYGFAEDPAKVTEKILALQSGN